MSIIGIIASERQTKQIKKQIEEEKIKAEIISINFNSIENVKNINFDVLVIQDSPEKLKENKKYLKLIFKNTKYLFLNTDVNINKDIFEGVNVKMLTYGLKQKATVTVSSIGEKQIIISIQRAFENFKRKIIEQQEIPVELIKNGSKDLYNSLIKIAIINVLGGKTS